MISTHTPRAGSDFGAGTILKSQIISTHTPRAGSDVGKQFHVHIEFISTHTPRAGSDTLTFITRHMERYFNPHSPCGE